MIAPRTRAVRGFTLVELLITAVVLGTAFIAASWSVSMTARTKEVYAKSDSPAFFLAKEIHELADGLPRVPSGAVGATSGAGIEALDSLVGAHFAPALLSDGSVASEFAGWSQDVNLGVFALNDLSTPTADDPALGLPADAAKLYRLDVRIRKDGQDIDNFQWWINP